jgi:hypothetical protein
MLFCSVLFLCFILFSFNAFLFVLEFIIAKTLPPEIFVTAFDDRKRNQGKQKSV